MRTTLQRGLLFLKITAKSQGGKSKSLSSVGSLFAGSARSQTVLSRDGLELRAVRS